MNRLFVAILSLTLCLPALAAEGFSSLEEQMTGKQYTASGLDKLTPEELEALNNWIRNHSLATLDRPRAGGGTVAADGGTDERGFEKKKLAEMSDEPVHSRIKGSFTGWDGHAVFKLENGMIWEQADNDKFFIREVENPEVTIEPGSFNSWRLSIDGFHSECRVVRIQ